MQGVFFFLKHLHHIVSSATHSTQIQVVFAWSVLIYNTSTPTRLPNSFINMGPINLGKVASETPIEIIYASTSNALVYIMIY